MSPDIALAFWMLGVAVAHGLRFKVMPDDPPIRKFVAGGGMLFYAVVAGFALGLPLLGYILAITFPVVGLTVILATKQEIDTWQLAVGVTQFAALFYSAFVLIYTHI